jgi:predicted small metal-binding protein
MAREQKTIVCREHGRECDWEVRDSDEQEVLLATQEHERRRHAAEVTIEQLRWRLRPVRRGIGGL